MGNRVIERLKRLRHAEPPPVALVNEFAAMKPALPLDYLQTVQEANGCEGWVGGAWLRLYRLEDVRKINKWYGVDDFAPGLLLFGSNGGGEAFAFDCRQSPVAVLKIPFIPLDFEYAERVAADVAGLMDGIQTEGDDAIEPAVDGPRGMEIHEVTPIVFGGSPTDPKNKVLVPTQAHAELAMFWNRLFRRLRAERSQNAR